MVEKTILKSIYAATALTGTRTVIIGGTSGIGLGAARQIVAAGGKVTVISRTQEKVEAATKALGP